MLVGLCCSQFSENDLLRAPLPLMGAEGLLCFCGPRQSACVHVQSTVGVKKSVIRVANKLIRGVKTTVLALYACTYTLLPCSHTEIEITASGHWPFSVHFSKMANQNINQAGHTKICRQMMHAGSRDGVICTRV